MASGKRTALGMQLVWMLMMMWLQLLLVSSMVTFVAATAAAVMMMMMAMMMMRCGHRVAMASAQLCTAAAAAAMLHRHRRLCGIVSLASMAAIGVQLMAASLAAHTLCLLLSASYDSLLSIANSRLVHNHHLQCIEGDSHCRSRRRAIALMLALTLATATGTWQQLVVVVQVVLEATIVMALHKVHCLEVFIVGTCREQMIISAAAERDGQR